MYKIEGPPYWPTGACTPPPLTLFLSDWPPTSDQSDPCNLNWSHFKIVYWISRKKLVCWLDDDKTETSRQFVKKTFSDIDIEKEHKKKFIFKQSGKPRKAHVSWNNNCNTPSGFSFKLNTKLEPTFWYELWDFVTPALDFLVHFIEVPVVLKWQSPGNTDKQQNAKWPNVCLRPHVFLSLQGVRNLCYKSPSNHNLLA